jgi:hypothetical protein
MGIKTKATRGGNYVCKVGYFDIRQKINKPTQEKNRKGETPPPKGSTEASIFHGRELYKGGFNDHKKAIHYIWEEIKKSNLTHTVSKSVISKYKLV